jgi:hypothetical protein
MNEKTRDTNYEHINHTIHSEVSLNKKDLRGLLPKKKMTPCIWAEA